jgi:hypothetical protein
LHVCICPRPGSADLPGQLEPIVSPLWFSQCPGVIRAEALLIKPGDSTSVALAVHMGFLSLGLQSTFGITTIVAVACPMLHDCKNC